MTAPARSEREPRPETRAEPWRYRWCGMCRTWEWDSGAPLGWVPALLESGAHREP